MTEPIFVVGVNLRHAEIWSSLHITGCTRRPIFVSPSNVDNAFLGQRGRTIILLKDAYIPDDVLKQRISGRNILINLNERNLK